MELDIYSDIENYTDKKDYPQQIICNLLGLIKKDVVVEDENYFINIDHSLITPDISTYLPKERYHLYLHLYQYDPDYLKMYHHNPEPSFAFFIHDKETDTYDDDTIVNAFLGSAKEYEHLFGKKGIVKEFTNTSLKDIFRNNVYTYILDDVFQRTYPNIFSNPTPLTTKIVEDATDILWETYKDDNLLIPQDITKNAIDKAIKNALQIPDLPNPKEPVDNDWPLVKYVIEKEHVLLDDDTHKTVLEKYTNIKKKAKELRDDIKEIRQILSPDEEYGVNLNCAFYNSLGPIANTIGWYLEKEHLHNPFATMGNWGEIRNYLNKRGDLYVSTDK